MQAPAIADAGTCGLPGCRIRSLTCCHGEIAGHNDLFADLRLDCQGYIDSVQLCVAHGWHAAVVDQVNAGQHVQLCACRHEGNLLQQSHHDGQDS